MSYDVCHMHLFHQLNIYHDQVLQSTYQWKYVCWHKTHKATLGQSHINSFWNSHLCFKIWYLLQWVTLFFSSNTDPRLTCVRVLMVRFSLIHQRSLSENVLWSLSFPFTHRFIVKKLGTASFDRKGPRISELPGHDSTIKFKQQYFRGFSCYFKISKLNSTLSVFILFNFSKGERDGVSGIHISLSFVRNVFWKKI